MIAVFGEGRGFRVVWLLEEMGLAYRLRPVDLLAGAVSRLKLVTRQLARSPYLAGDRFTAPDMFGHLRLGAGSKNWRLCTRRCKAGLRASHERTRGLQAGNGKMRCDEGMGCRGGQSMAAPMGEDRSGAYLESGQ
jgi:glutathione S-transferase